DGDLRVDIAHKMLLVRMRHCTGRSEDGSLGNVEDRVWEVDLPDDWIKMKDRRARDMTWQEMLDKKRDLQAQIDRDSAEVAVCAQILLLNTAPVELPRYVKNLKERIAYSRSQIILLDVELNMRPALSFGCLCFILAGCPVGIWLSKSDYLSSFITCFLPIVFIYYPLMLCGSNFAKEGKLPPALDVWAANGSMGVIALVLFRRLLRT